MALGSASGGGLLGLKAAASLAAGTGITALSVLQQGMQANANAKFESQQLAIQAKRDQEIAKINAEDFRNSEARRQATLRARVGGSGVTMEGSPLAVMSNIADEAEFQALRIEAGGDPTQARNAATLKRVEGRSAQRAGFMRAGATLLSGAGKFGAR